MDMAAVSTFFRLPELLLCLAENIRNRRQLATLRLVSRAFNDAATRFLFREIEIDIGESEIWSIHDEAHLDHIKNVAVRPTSDRGSGDANAFLRELLPKLRCLKRFE
jgi:hypothetical protein